MLRLRVKEVAKAKGMTMGRLSRLANVDRTTLKYIYDKANYDPRISTMSRLAKVLKVKVDELFEMLPDSELNE